MSVDISKLTEKQLFGLHNEIVDRINELRHKSHSKALARYQVGEEVYFNSPHGRIDGKVMRVNKKTLSIITDQHTQWNISPTLVKKVIQRKVKDKKRKLTLLS